MKTIYLHVGTEKTGTTSFQRFCAKNTEFLAQNDILYPHGNGKRYCLDDTHWPLAACFQDADKKLLNTANFDLIKSQFKEDIYNSNESKILISAEPFSSHVTQYESLEKLKYFLEDFDVKILICFQRQDFFLNSTISTLVKGGASLHDVMLNIDSDREGYKNKFRYDYTYLSDIYSSFFGKENFIPFNFEHCKVNGLIESILRPLDVTIPDINGNATQIRLNKSLNMHTAYFVSMLNMAGLVENSKRNLLINFLEKISQEKTSFITSQLGREIIDFYHESNIALGQKYFGINGTPFGENLSMYPSELNRTSSQNQTSIIETLSEKMPDLFDEFSFKIASKNKKIFLTDSRNKYNKILSDIEVDHFFNFFVNT